jgi:acyl transferase domain-containing protein
MDKTRMDAPVAIVGMAGLFPRAQGLKQYWRLLRRAEDAVDDVPASHWALDDFFDGDPKAADMTYCRRGAFLSAVPFDPTEFGIPPTALEATDTAQLLALVAARDALHDAGYGSNGDGPTRAFDRARASVILGVTGALELVVPLGARLGHPHWRRALRDAGVDAATADDVVRRISDAYVGWQENSFPGLLGNVVAGRIANRLDLKGTNCVVDAACASSLSAVHLAALE